LHFSLRVIKNNASLIYLFHQSFRKENRNPDSSLGQAQQYGGIKPFIAIPITSLDNMIHSDKNMYINKAKFPKYIIIIIIIIISIIIIIINVIK
jgi:hypothetical protein